MSFKSKLFASLLLICLDQATKLIFASSAVINTGGIFGIGKNLWWELLLLPLLIFIGYVWFREKNVPIAVGLTLLVSGGLGNVLDRFFRDGVIDFIHYPIIAISGNIADIYLALAITIIFVQGLFPKTWKKKL